VSLVVDRRAPVSSLVKVTVALATALPDGSWTVPLMVPRMVCA
jgi:hypothetical protein